MRSLIVKKCSKAGGSGTVVAHKGKKWVGHAQPNRFRCLWFEPIYYSHLDTIHNTGIYGSQPPWCVTRHPGQLSLPSLTGSINKEGLCKWVSEVWQVMGEVWYAAQVHNIKCLLTAGSSQDNGNRDDHCYMIR